MKMYILTFTSLLFLAMPFAHAGDNDDDDKGGSSVDISDTACAICHGADGTGAAPSDFENIVGACPGEIREAIAEEQAMQFLASLPDSEIVRISGLLGCNADGDRDDDDDDDRDRKRRSKRD